MAVEEASRWTGWKRGAIVRIELVNFMIHENLTFEPGPYLNLILGPNGAGKSAIVCSIIMGFGGDPQITGRSSNLVDYIRFGSTSSTITIEVYSGNANTPNSLIERRMRIVSKNAKNECVTSWKINRETVSKADVLQFINDLNIEINNLCQVLPQERVVEFSRLSPKDLLVSTEKSIGDIVLYQRHIKLIELSKEVKDLEHKIKDCQSFITKCNQYKSTMEPDLQMIKQKKKFEEEIEWFNKKKVWLAYETIRTNYLELKEECNDLNQKLEEKEALIKPTKDCIDEYEIVIRKLKDESNRLSNVKQSNTFSNKVNKLKNMIAELSRKSMEHDEDFSNEQNLKRRILVQQQHLENFKNDRKNYSDESSKIESILDSIKQEIDEIEKQLKPITDNIAHLRMKKQNLDKENGRLLAEKDYLNNLFNQRLNKVLDINKNAKTVCDFLKNNRSMFSGKVFPPILTQINVKNSKYIQYVESAISANDLATILFEKKEDLTLFSRELKVKHNIRFPSAIVPRNFTIDDCKSTIDLENLKQYGIFASVRDLFTAPDQVMIYLCKLFNIHKVPVGDENADRNITKIMESSNFRRVITAENVHNIIVSSYDKSHSSKVSELRPAKFLNIITDQARIDENKRRLDKINTELADFEKSMEQAVREEKVLNKQHDDKVNEQQEHKSKLDRIEALDIKIHEREQQIKDCQRKLDSIQKIRQNLSRSLEKDQSTILNLLEDVTENYKTPTEVNISSYLPDIKINVLNKLIIDVKSKFETMNFEIERLRNEKKNLCGQLRNLRDKAKDARNHAKEFSGFDIAEIGETSEIAKKFQDMPATIEELDSSIAILKLRCEGFAHVDETIIEEYKRYQDEVAVKTKENEKLNQELEIKIEEIESNHPLWYSSLNTIVKKINENYSKFMEHLEYSGEVYISESGKKYAYDEYGIGVKVKFRDSEPMKDLDACHQSGGERSVSTMIYMLALQELAQVPFRVVDEINQGMDEKNERYVFDLIADVSRSNSSQYFLLSPKLLYDLNYTEEMKVHIIFNGPQMHINWPDVLRQLEQNDD